MDVVSHLIAGRLLAQFAKRLPLAPSAASSTSTAASVPSSSARALPAGLMTAFVLGAIAPDIDVVLMPSGWDWYLLWHQRGTHALIGTMACALLLAGLLRLRHRTTFAVLFRGAWLGALSHVALDLVSGSQIQLGWPATPMRMGTALTAMGDPLIAVPLALFFLTTLAWPRRATVAAVIALGSIAGVLALKEVSRVRALDAYRTAAFARGERVEPADVEARWASFTQWWIYDRGDTALRTWRVDAWRRSVKLEASRERTPETPLVRASRTLSTVRHFRDLYDLEFFKETPTASGTEVLWSDVRFCDRTTCALWFGGVFDGAGRPIEEVILVGTWRQTRAP